MSSKIFSVGVVGLDAAIIEVESDLSAQLPGITIVGLPDQAVGESKERVKSAIKNSGLEFPRTKVTVNLAPADLKKQGPAYDFPIAVSILAATEVLPATWDGRSCAIVGDWHWTGGSGRCRESWPWRWRPNNKT